MFSSSALVIAKTLQSLGVDIVFGVVGIPVTQIAFELQNVGCKFIAHRSEGPALYAASCYGYLTSARTGMPGVALTTGGPGFINAIAGFGHATINRWPLVVLSGSSHRNEVGKGAFQELDQRKIINGNSELCKGTFAIDSVYVIPKILKEACALAVEGVPGSVYVDVPTDVLQQSIEELALSQLVKEITRLQSILVIPTLLKSSFTEICQVLRNAESPLFVIGKGTAQSHCEKHMLELIELIRVPFLPSPMGRGVISDDHELSVISERSKVLREADVVCLFGARLNWILHYGEAPRWNENAKFIVFDLDDKVHERVFAHVKGDLLLSIPYLISQLRLDSVKLTDRAVHWIKSVTESALKKKAAVGLEVSSKSSKGGALLKYKEAMGIIKMQLDYLKWREPESRITIVSEGSNTMDISRTALPVYCPRGRLDAGTWGTMGVGLAFSVAANISDPSPLHYVVAIEGDSAIGFSLAELETITRYNLPIIVIVFNNGGVYSGMTSPTTTPLPTQLSQHTKYEDIMSACGGVGLKAETTFELKEYLSQALFRLPRRSYLINVLIDPLDSNTTGGIIKRHEMTNH